MFHGCGGTCDIGYVKNNGVLKYAATNRLVVLAPQVGDTYIGKGDASGSVQTCFDNYGDTGAEYCLQNGTQMAAVERMINALRKEQSPTPSPPPPPEPCAWCTGQS